MEFLALLITSLISPAILLVMQKKIKESHRQLTVNHHSSDNPTVMDMLSDLIQGQRTTNEKIDRHIEWHLQNREKE